MLVAHDGQMGMWATVPRTWFYVENQMQACDESSSQPLGLSLMTTFFLLLQKSMYQDLG